MLIVHNATLKSPLVEICTIDSIGESHVYMEEVGCAYPKKWFPNAEAGQRWLIIQDDTVWGFGDIRAVWLLEGEEDESTNNRKEDGS